MDRHSEEEGKGHKTCTGPTRSGQPQHSGFGLQRETQVRPLRRWMEAAEAGQRRLTGVECPLHVEVAAQVAWHPTGNGAYHGG